MLSSKAENALKQARKTHDNLLNIIAFEQSLPDEPAKEKVQGEVQQVGDKLEQVR